MEFIDDKPVIVIDKPISLNILLGVFSYLLD